MYPDDEKMQKLGDFINTVDECWRILTSKKVIDDDPLKSGLEVHLKKQKESLEKLVQYMKSIKIADRSEGRRTCGQPSQRHRSNHLASSLAHATSMTAGMNPETSPRSTTSGFSIDELMKR